MEPMLANLAYQPISSFAEGKTALNRETKYRMFGRVGRD